MKKLLLFGLLIINIAGLCQKNKIYATVFDEDKNPIARGIFKSAADSGVIILVDDMEIFVNATEIAVLKIEKNSSKAEFIKLGAATATDMVSYLINRPKKESESEETDSIGTEANPISTETKDALFLRINNLIENLLNGKNDLATMNINNSSEKFLTKLRLLQEYSMEKEIVVWNDYSQTQQPANEMENPGQEQEIQNETAADQTIQTDQATQTASSATPKNQSNKVFAENKTFKLDKGFVLINSKSAASKQIKGNNQASTNKIPHSKTPELKQINKKIGNPAISNKNPTSSEKKDPKKKTKPKTVNSVKTAVALPIKKQ